MAYGYSEARVRFIPTAREIAQAETVGIWLAWLGSHHGGVRLLVSWAHDDPIWRIADRERCSVRAVHNRIDRAMAAILKEFGGVEMDLSTIEERTDKAHPPNFMIERPVIAEAGVRNQHGKAWIDGVGFMKETASRSGTVATRLRTGCGMPVDLADYSPNLKAGLKKAGFACVYVASFESGRPCRVGYALDLGEAIKRFQRTSPLPIVVHGAMWVPDRGMATRIAQSVLASIAPHRKAGGRHDLPAEAASGEVGLTTSRLYPGAVTVPHDQLIGRWAKERA